MKKQSIAVLTFLALLLSAVTSTAYAEAQSQGLGEVVFPAIRSHSAFRAHILSQVTGGSMSIGAPGIQAAGKSPTDLYVSIQGGSPEKIQAGLSANNFEFTMPDPADDTLFVYSSLTMTLNGYPYPLFSVSTQVKAQKDPLSGKLVFPKPILHMRLNSLNKNGAPIEVGEDVYFVQLFYRDNNGNLQWIDNLRVEGGYMFFKDEYISNSGQIILYKNDGTQQAIDLKSGAEILEQTLTAGAALVLNNYREVGDGGITDPANGQPNPLSVSFSPQGSRDGSDAPVIRLELAKARSVIVFGGTAINGSGNVEIPTITAYGPSGQEVTVPYSSAGTTIPTDEAGVWWITFDYPTLFGNDVPPSPPYYGGGGGGPGQG